MEIKKMFFALLRCELNNICIDEDIRRALEDETTLNELYCISKKYDLAHLIANTLDKSGIQKEGEIFEKFHKQHKLAVYRDEQMAYEREQIKKIFSDVGIEFVLLKGSVIRDYYPETWMRTSCDIDILIHEEDIDKAIETVKKFGYKNEERSYRDILIIAPSGVHVELHFSIKQAIKSVDKVLERVWENVEKNEAGICNLCNNFFYFHIVAHTAYHFRRGGCGVRPFIDLWLLKKTMVVDDQKINEFCKESEIYSFYKVAQKLIQVWFENKELDTDLKEVENYLLSAGLYGSTENHVLIERNRKGGKLRYIFSRLFLPYEVLKEYYPRLKGKKLLTPFYQIKRWFGLFSFKRLRRVSSELNVKGRAEKTEKLKQIMDYVDL